MPRFGAALPGSIGKHDSLLEAGEFIRALDRRQSVQVGAPEEVAWKMGFIDDAQLARLSEPFGNSSYGLSLRRLLANITASDSDVMSRRPEAEIVF